MPSRYPLEQAISDVVQRCIEAGAAQVDIAVEFAGPRSWMRVAADAAPAAVAPGVASVGHAADTAVMPSPATAAGLDVVSACLTQGAAVTLSPDDGDDHTVLRVEGLHDVLAYKRREGRLIEAVVARMQARIRDALGLAFHRTLSGTQHHGAACGISVNAEAVVARAPFGPDAEMRGARRRELPFVVDGRVETAVAAPYALAPFDDDPANGRQGFFVYVRDRLVQAGGWSRLNLAGHPEAIARVAVDLPDAAIDSFTWEAAARRVLFPPALAPALRAVAREAVSMPVAAAGRAEHAMLGADARAHRR